MNEKDISKNKRKSAEETESVYNISTPRISSTKPVPSIAYHVNDFITRTINTQQRKKDFQRYLQLFGYKPENTILQIHIAGFFNKKQSTQTEMEKRKESVRRYGGTTFAIIGRTHDPSITENVIEPKKKDPYERSPGYIGYLWKRKDRYGRAPHETLPLDFTPIHIPYPKEWKAVFATKGFMVALHVPGSFATKKNEIMRVLYRVGKRSTVDIRKEWSFLDELEQILDLKTKQQIKISQPEKDLEEIIKRRLVNGEITREEFLDLKRIINS